MKGTRLVGERETEPAATSAPLTIEQIVGHERPVEVVMTPDGALIAYTVKAVSREGEHPQSAIWVVPFDEGEPRQFTTGLTADESPHWSPSGDRLAFVSDRAERGKASVYVMPAAGGEGVRVFDQQGGITRLGWSPDGSRLSFVYTPGETEAEKKRKEQREDWHVWDADLKFGRLWVLDLATRQARAITPEDRHVWGYAWSPDGRRIAINVTASPRIDDIFRETDVALVDVATGELTPLFTQRGLASDLVWSSDGAHLAFRAAPERVVEEEYVYARPIAGGDAVCLTPGYAGSAVFLTPIGAGDALLLQTIEGVNSRLYRLEWDGTRSPIVDGDPWGVFESRVAISADGSRIAGIWEDGRNAPDIWAGCTRGYGPDTTLRRRTRLNPGLETALLGETEIVRWASDPGVEVEGLLIKPVGYEKGKRYPLVVQVHGGPTWAWPNGFYASWHDWGQFLAGAGYAVLLPNPRGSTGRGPAWSNAIFGDVGGGEYRDMLAGVDAMIARGIADPERLGIGGWSWGGYMTAWTVSQTSRFKAAVMGAGLPNMISDNSLGDIPSANLSYFEATPYHDPDPYYERSAIRHIRNATTPTLILHGEADKRVHHAQGVEMYVALRTLGVKTQLVTYPRQEHGIEERKHQMDLLSRVRNWFDAHLTPAGDDGGAG